VRSRNALSDDGLLLLETSPLFRLHEDQDGEHDPVLLREKFGLDLNGLDFKRFLREFHEASTSSIFLPESLIIPLGRQP
jgi:hypothetical protein